MLRITKLTDYGIVLLTHLGAHPERQFAAPELAAETRLPLPMVSKILKLLTRERLLASSRGVKGGYGLAIPPEALSMARIITALEGPIAITECVDTTGECSHEQLCPSRGNWQRINSALRVALEGISLAEMIPAPSLANRLVTIGSNRGASRSASPSTPQAPSL
jgi:FeS assembly SUF system regulator